MLLNLIGLESQDIFETLIVAGNTYADALAALNTHFEVQKNVPYERSKFHQAKQTNESIEQFITRLRQLSLYCEYTDADEQIRDHVIVACSSSKFRKRLLTEKDLTLDKTIQIGRTMESANIHTKEIEEHNSEKSFKINSDSVNYVTSGNRYPNRHNHQQTSSTHRNTKSCGRSGGSGHLSQDCRRSKGKTCTKCGKLGHFAKMCCSRTDEKDIKQHRSERKPHHKIRSTTHQDSSDSDSEDVYVFHIQKPNQLPRYPVKINNTEIKVLIDSGSTLNILDKATYESLKSRPALSPTTIKIYPYKAEKPIAVEGSFQSMISSNKQTTTAKFYITSGTAGTLLSKETAESLNLLRVGPPMTIISNVQHQSPSIPNSTQKIIDSHKSVFEGTGLLKDYELQLHIDPSVTPIQQPIRRVPFHTRKKVEDELDRLIQLDIIEPVNGPTSWLNPFVPVPKADGTIRLCLDMRQANKAIIRERHVIPKMEDILPELHGAGIFSKIDLREGYHQLMLHEDSRPITAFATHKGVHRYKRLIYGVSSAFESFQKKIEQAISRCEGTKNISDDIIIWASSIDQHNKRLSKLLSTFENNGLKINPKKCIFAVDKLTFAGHTLSSTGISPDPKKVKTIQDAKPPANASEVKSFMGMINYCHQYIKDYSDISAPLRLLTKKNQPFIWEDAQQAAFDKLKDRLSSCSVMAFYNPQAETHLTVDASPFGLGAILAQRQSDGSYRPIAYGSRSTTDVESRYSQTEREALAVLWACQHFHHYVFDRHITINTDYKPLEKLLSNNSNPPPRIQRWILHLQAYDYTIRYIPGKDNPADVPFQKCCKFVN